MGRHREEDRKNEENKVERRGEHRREGGRSLIYGQQRMVPTSVMR